MGVRVMVHVHGVHMAGWDWVGRAGVLSSGEEYGAAEVGVP